MDKFIFIIYIKWKYQHLFNITHGVMKIKLDNKSEENVQTLRAIEMRAFSFSVKYKDFTDVM